MNKKIIAGLLSAAAVGSFWACGSGSINEPDNADSIVQMTFTPEGNPDLEKIQANLITPAKDKCKNDPVCSAENPNFVNDIVAPTPDPDKPDVGQSSSSVGGFTPNPLSSSSIAIQIKPNSSADVGVEPSSSAGGGDVVITPSSELGTCTTETPVIEKTGSVVFKFNPDPKQNPLDFIGAKASFVWNYGADGVGDGSANTTNSDKVTFASSGKKHVTVTVTKNDGLTSDVVDCGYVQVNGDPITGCLCTTTASGSVDYTTTPEVTWSVAGCTTGAAYTIGYNWDGTAGEATYTKTFSAANPGYAPKLKVSNTDNTEIEVACPAVKITEGAEYTIKDNTDAGKVAIPAAGTYNVVIGFACTNKTFFCNGAGGPVGGSVNGVPMESSWYTTASLTDADCTGNATVTLIVDGPATCGAQ